MNSRRRSASKSLSIEAITDHSTMHVSLCGCAQTNGQDLPAALAGLDLAEIRQVHLDLARLEFCDARALCHLLDFAQQASHGGRCVTLDNTSHLVKKMTRLLGSD